MGKQFPLNPPILFIALIISTTIFCCSFNMAEGIIGMNWGRRASHRLIPSMVADLLLQNGIRHLKLFSPSENVLMAFVGGDIIITVAMPNEGLQHINTEILAQFWLQERIRKFQNQNINIRGIHVGSEPFSPANRNVSQDKSIDVLRYIQNALITNGYENVVATTPHFTDVLKPNIKKPSQADFHPDVKDKMVQFVRLLNRTNAPFVIHLFPIYFANEYNWDIEFSFIDNKSNFTITDNGRVYRNVFEFVYDSFLFAIRKAGGPQLKVVVGQIGWPTDGYPGASVANAERFYREFLPYARGTKGTPLRPGISIDVFVHSLADENLNSLTRGGLDRHMGIYKSNGEPKYKIDFTGQGRDIYPSTAKGVILMPKRWCIFNGNTKNLTKVNEKFEFACNKSDCTTLFPGGSCSHLNFKQNVSYAFNRYYQSTAQYSNNGSECDFDGLGKVVTDDPSMGTCNFPIEILAAEKADRMGVNGAAAEGLRGLSESTLFWALVLVCFLQLI